MGRRLQLLYGVTCPCFDFWPQLSDSFTLQAQKYIGCSQIVIIPSNTLQVCRNLFLDLSVNNCVTYSKNDRNLRKSEPGPRRHLTIGGSSDFTDRTPLGTQGLFSISCRICKDGGDRSPIWRHGWPGFHVCALNKIITVWKRNSQSGYHA